MVDGKDKKEEESTMTTKTMPKQASTMNLTMGMLVANNINTNKKDKKDKKEKKDKKKKDSQDTDSQKKNNNRNDNDLGQNQNAKKKDKDKNKDDKESKGGKGTQDERGLESGTTMKNRNQGPDMTQMATNQDPAAEEAPSPDQADAEAEEHEEEDDIERCEVGAHDPEEIHKILTKIHFPSMHPMFLAENVAPAVLPSNLLSDHEMVTIFVDCLSRSPNKFNLFPNDKRSITPLLSIRPIRSTERPFTIEFNRRDRIGKELKQRIELVSGLPPDRYTLRSQDDNVNAKLQVGPDSVTVGDLGLKEGDKLELVQSIRVKVIGPLADDYGTEPDYMNDGGQSEGCNARCAGPCAFPAPPCNDAPAPCYRNTLGTVDVIETDKMRDLKPKVQRVLQDRGMNVDGLVFKSKCGEVCDSAGFFECSVDHTGCGPCGPCGPCTGPPQRAARYEDDVFIGRGGPRSSEEGDPCGPCGPCAPCASGMGPRRGGGAADEYCAKPGCDETRCVGACRRM